MRLIAAFLLMSLVSNPIQAQESKPLWEWGLGVAHLRFEQYPSSDQYTSLSIPIPTFQYRGEILRADDRDGARAYLLKESSYSLEFSGGGNPPVRSDDNLARQGMADIPWIALMGPQLVYKVYPGLEFKLAAFQAISTNFSLTKFAGEALEIEIDYHWSNDSGAGGKLSTNILFASKQYLAHFFEVSTQDATTDRPRYQSKPGFYGSEISYFQTYKTGLTTLFAAISVNDYAGSANRESPLHRRDISTNYLVGFSYILGQSERRSIPLDEGDGLFEKLVRRGNHYL